ncbi:MAG: SAM-dependent methyltransferase [Variovorax sp.]
MTEKRRYFEALYGASSDPYALRTRWYEARKRAVLLAALPLPRYASAYEPGCGIGELTAQLAPRCDRLLASDFNADAVAAARHRTAGMGHVAIERHVLPGDWPPLQAGLPLGGQFDLIVLSEVGYFLDAAAMASIAGHCDRSLSQNGTLVACDWRPDFAERVLSTADVQATLATIGLGCIVRHEEDDFMLQIWSRDRRSVAQQEGIR